jgi:XTP/dITP diphosphohydrolase
VDRIRVRLASGNPHKLRELRALLHWDLEPLDTTAMPEEAGETFYANARAKARFGRVVGGLDVWTLGEDSGLEVAGLDGRPGIRSARYAGPDASDEENLAKLLGELRSVDGDGRRARYLCELVLISPGLTEFRGTGTLEGRIAEEPRGAGGFGYDPIFVPAGESSTVAELGDAWKARNSHRAHAAAALLETVGSAAGEG